MVAILLVEMDIVNHGMVKPVVRVHKIVGAVHPILFVATANAKRCTEKIVASVHRIVVGVLIVEMANVTLERIGVIVFKIVLHVEMVLVKVGMEKIVALVLVIVDPVDPITGALEGIHSLERYAIVMKCLTPDHARRVLHQVLL